MSSPKTLPRTNTGKTRSPWRELSYASLHLWRAAKAAFPYLMTRQVGLVTIGIIAGGFLASLIFASFVPYPPASATSAPGSQALGLPDWIQALSSIVAIAVAIGLAVNERSVSRRERAFDQANHRRNELARKRMALSQVAAQLVPPRARLEGIIKHMEKEAIKDSKTPEAAIRQMQTLFSFLDNWIPPGVGSDICWIADPTGELAIEVFLGDELLKALQRLAETCKEIVSGIVTGKDNQPSNILTLPGAMARDFGNISQSAYSQYEKSSDIAKRLLRP